jgi:tetratricopeptide (TPR) repeat protein
MQMKRAQTPSRIDLAARNHDIDSRNLADKKSRIAEIWNAGSMFCSPFKRLDRRWCSFPIALPVLRVFYVTCCLIIVAISLFPLSSPRGQAPVIDSKNQPKASTGDKQGSAVLQEEPTDPLLEQARALLDKGSLKEAEIAVRQYLDKNANSGNGHFLLGHILFREHKAQASLAEYTQGAKFHDPGAFDLKIVGLDYVLLGSYADADHWLTRSLERDPKDSQAWYYLGRTKYNENRFEEAINAFKQCLRLDPKNVKAEDNLGLSYQGLGRTDDAASAYRNAIAWQTHMLEKHFGPFLDLGSLLLEQDRTEEAISYLLQAVEISPQESKLHEQLGKAYSRLNQLPKAQAELEKAVALAPENPSLHFMLGQVYRKQGMTDKARFELERGAALNGSSRPPTPTAPAIDN